MVSRKSAENRKKEKEKLTITNYSKVPVMTEVWGKPAQLDGNSEMEFYK
jgi:hypothetical protein